MRKIKFRIYDKKLKEFHYLDLEDLWGDDYWYDGEITMWDVLYDCNNSQERFVIQQYTGLYDTHEAEIYEGDIVKVSEIEDDNKIVYLYHKVVNFEKGCFRFGCKEFSVYNTCSKMFEVVGNVYENPELLE